MIVETAVVQVIDHFPHIKQYLHSHPTISTLSTFIIKLSYLRHVAADWKIHLDFIKIIQKMMFCICNAFKKKFKCAILDIFATFTEDGEKTHCSQHPSLLPSRLPTPAAHRFKQPT